MKMSEKKNCLTCEFAPNFEQKGRKHCKLSFFERSKYPLFYKKDSGEIWYEYGEITECPCWNWK